MVVIKEGVIFKRLKPEIYGLFSLLDRLWSEYGVECVITAANDGKHKVGSLHYQDAALDVRSKNLPSEQAKHDLHAQLMHKLGGDYDVLFESPGQQQEHFHIEVSKVWEKAHSKGGG